jgi:diguanylate cyclase (GGDEF)-like protein
MRQVATRVPPPKVARSSLGGLLRRAHVALALGAVALVGLVLSVPAVVTLQFYTEHDLQLLGRAIGHMMEAAVVFQDAEAAQEGLESIVADEDLAEATVTAADGKVLARWHVAAPDWQHRLGGLAAGLLRQQPMTVAVEHDGAVVGQVTVRGGGRTLVQVLGLGAFGILFCQALIGAGALYMSRRVVGRIIRPLQALADLTGTVQRERAFGQRVPGAEIRELNDLGTSFNALLEELDAWQTLMEGENQRLLHQARHDGLTGLANRAYFEGRLNRALSEAAQAGTGAAVLLIDCDKFKSINDGLGHAAGDAVLIAVAARLRGACREHDLVARLGGDEFAILIPSCADAFGPLRLAAAIETAMQVPIPVRDDHGLTVSLSIGVATYPVDGADARALLQHADELMYAAKRSRVSPSLRPDPVPQR